MQEKTKKLLLLGIVVVVAGAALIAVAEQRYGPYVCSACEITTPTTDRATKAYLDSIRPLMEIPFIDRTWIVCNSSHCADYTLTAQYTGFGSTYEGQNRRAREGGSNEREGADGKQQGGYNPGAGGGGGGSGGSARNGSGTVIVGETVPTKDR